MSDDSLVIGCSPVSQGPSNVPNSTQGTCRVCGTGVWLAPSTREIMAEQPGLVTWCVPCVLAQADEDGDKELKVWMHRRQVGEVRAYFERERD